MEKIKLYLPSVDKCPKISFQMRLLSFLICLIIGFSLTSLSIFQLTYTLPHYRTFSLWYSLSNIIFLISTFILIGPKENYIKLLSDELYSKSLIFISTTILGFIFGLMTGSKVVNLLFDFLEFCSLVFFCFSFISSFKEKNINIEDYQNENNVNDNVNNNYLMN